MAELRPTLEPSHSRNHDLSRAQHEVYQLPTEATAHRMDMPAPPLLCQSNLLDKGTVGSYLLWGANHMTKCKGLHRLGMVLSFKVGIISPILQVNKTVQ